MSKHTQNTMDFDLSNRQENRIRAMVHKVLVNSGAADGIGTSRAVDKAEHAGDSHHMSMQTSIHSYGSYHKMENVGRLFARYCFTGYGIKTLDRITPQMARDFVQDLGARGYARNTIDSYASHILKFGALLDKAYGCGDRARTWTQAVNTVRADVLRDARDPSTASRAYADPWALVHAIQDPACRVAAELQLGYGLRVGDALKLTELYHTGGIASSKGGQAIKLNLSDSTKQALIDLGDAGRHISRGEYQNALKEAATATNQAYTGTHGLRHCYAQADYKARTEAGMSKAEALRAVAEDMGHHRADITLTYLR